MSSLQSRERAQADEAVEIFSKVEDEIRDFVRRDAAVSWQPSADHADLTPSSVGFLLQRECGNAVEEIDYAITQLKRLRDTLENETRRVQREILEYALLNQAAKQAMKSSLERLAVWKTGRDGISARATSNSR